MALTKKLKINGMSCEKCASKIEQALKSIDGVRDAKVDLGSKTAEVVLKRTIEDKVFTDTVFDAGYDVLEIS